MSITDNNGVSSALVSDKSKDTKEKLSNIDLMKIFVDNYAELNSLPLIKRSCLNFQRYMKISPVLRA